MSNLEGLENELKELLDSPRSPACFDGNQLTFDINNDTLRAQFCVSFNDNDTVSVSVTVNEDFETAEREKVLQAARDFKSKYIKG